ncbi:hypothetical protein [Photobacterium chitinilyticum]|nr:hypothetical protein [Photobacterium chitinilyticum]
MKYSVFASQADEKQSRQRQKMTTTEKSVQDAEQEFTCVQSD